MQRKCKENIFILPAKNTNEVTAFETFRNSFKISLIVVVLWPRVVAAQPDPSLSLGK